MDKRLKKQWVRICIGCAMLLTTSAQADQWVMALAYEYESGEYSSDLETEVTTIPVALEYYGESWSFAVEVPYITITGDSERIPGSDGGSMGHGMGSSGGGGSSTIQSVTRSGLGDASVSATRAFFPKQSGDFFYKVGASIKLPTANEDKNLGTGETDFSFKLAISNEYGYWLPGLSVGYQITGDRADTDFNDVLFYSIGTGYQLPNYTVIGIGYDFKQALSDDDDDFAAITIDLSHELENRSKLGVAFKSGLTDNSPDYGFSLSWAMPL